MEQLPDRLELPANSVQRITIVPERNQCGTWSLTAYIQHLDGARQGRKVATCETFEDSCYVLKDIWSKIAKT